MREGKQNERDECEQRRYGHISNRTPRAGHNMLMSIYCTRRSKTRARAESSDERELGVRELHRRSFGCFDPAKQVRVSDGRGAEPQCQAVAFKVLLQVQHGAVGV